MPMFLRKMHSCHQSMEQCELLGREVQSAVTSKHIHKFVLQGVVRHQKGGCSLSCLASDSW